MRPCSNRCRRAGRSCRGRASFFLELRGGFKRFHVGLVTGNPCLDLRLGHVADRHSHGRVQEKPAIAFLDEEHGVTKLIEAHLASEFRWQRQAAAFGEGERCHAAMLHRSNA
jgi:hypothetical protein